MTDQVRQEHTTSSVLEEQTVNRFNVATACLALTLLLRFSRIFLFAAMTSPVAILCDDAFAASSLNQDTKEPATDETPNTHILEDRAGQESNPSVIENYSSEGLTGHLQVGSVDIYLSYRIGPGILEKNDNANFELVSIAKHPERYGKHFVAMFQQPSEPNVLYTVAHLKADHSKGMVIYRYELTPDWIAAAKEKQANPLTDETSRKKPKRINATISARIERELFEPQIFQATDGSVFIWSRSGVIARWHQGNFSQYNVPTPKNETPEGDGLFREIEIAVSRGGQVCFFSQSDPQDNTRAMRSLVTFQNDAWKEIPVGERIIGSVCFGDEQVVSVFTKTNRLQVDLQSGEIEEFSHKPLMEGEDELLPTYAYSHKPGEFVTFWRRRFERPRRYAVKGFESDCFFRAAIFKDNAWQSIPLNINRRLYGHMHGSYDSAGRLWLGTMDSHLICFELDGRWRDFSWRDGIPVAKFDSIVLRSPDRLAVSAFVDELSTFAVDLNRLGESPEQTLREWSDYSIREYGQTLQVQAVTAITLAGNVVTFGQSEKLVPTSISTKISFRPGEGEPGVTLALDSEDRLWCFGQHFGSPVAFWEGNDWMTFGEFSPTKKTEYKSTTHADWRENLLAALKEWHKSHAGKRLTICGKNLRIFVDENFQIVCWELNHVAIWVNDQWVLHVLDDQTDDSYREGLFIAQFWPPLFVDGTLQLRTSPTTISHLEYARKHLADEPHVKRTTIHTAEVNADIKCVGPVVVLEPIEEKSESPSVGRRYRFRFDYALGLGSSAVSFERVPFPYDKYSHTFRDKRHRLFMVARQEWANSLAA